MSGSKTLMLLRHAKSSWQDLTSDHERPLNGRGERDARRLGHLLQGLEHPELIIGSNARRVRQTLDGLLSGADYGGDVLLTPRLYLTGPREYLAELQGAAASEASRVMLVGHNPTLEELLAALTGVGLEPFPMGTFVVLSSTAQCWDQLLEVGATRVAVYHARELPDSG